MRTASSAVLGAGSIGKQSDVVRNVIQNIGKSALIGPAKSQCDDLGTCVFNAGFYRLRENFPGAQDKTGGKGKVLQESMDQ